MKRMLVLLAIATSIVAEEIPSPAASGASLPFLTTAGDGAPLMSWVEGTTLKFAAYRDGRWSAPRTILQRDDMMVNWANAPAIVGAGENLYALWLAKRGHGHAADAYMTASRDGGATWTPSMLIHRDGKEAEHGFASLVPLGSDAGVTWLDGREMSGHDGEMTLRYARVSAKGELSREAVLDKRVCECCGTGMAMAADGPVIVYRDRSADERRDISLVRWTGGKWSQPADVHADGWKLKGCPVNGPQIDAHGAKVVVAWFTSAPEPRVNVAFSADGGATFAGTAPVDSGPVAGRAEVLLLPNGDALVIWLDGLGEKASIATRRVSPSGVAGPIVTIGTTSGARSSGFPRAVVAGRHVYVAWTDTNARQIRVARLTG
jgi:hypothetical protein